METQYRGHRFPPEIISHAVWLYHRFTLSFRDVEDLLAEQAGVFHGFLPTPSSYCFYTVLWSSAFARNTYGLARLMGEFPDGFLTVVAATAMLYWLRSTLLQ